jgi:tetratricopeptide (TPR) repeat protein
VTGLLFGLHPVHVESAAWVAERKDLLCALFFLLSLVMYTKYADGRHWTEGKHETDRKFPFTDKNYLLTLAFFVLALLSKPMAVSLPVVLLVLDWYPFHRIYSGKTFRSALVEKMPLAAFALASSIVTILAQKAVGALIATQTIPLSSRVLVAAKSLIGYLLKMAFPYNLIPFYSYPGPSDISLYHLEYPLSIAVLIGITTACVALMKKQKLWLSSWGYYVVTLLPVLGIIQVGGQAMADRYTYLPSLGPFLVTGLGAAWISEKTDALEKRARIIKVLVAIAAIFMLVFLSYLTVKQIGIWGNSIKLWNYTIEKTQERDPVSYYSRALAYDEMGQFESAIEDYDKAIALNPSFTNAYNNRGLDFYEIGQLDRAIADFDHAISLNPAHAQAYYNRGLVFDKMGQLDKALADYDRAISLSPYDVDAYNNRGKVFSRIGQLDRAIADFDHALSLNPAYSEAYYNRSLAFQKSGQPDKAAQDFMAWKAYSAKR